MQENRETVLGWIGQSEGGYVNHPRDPGGATNYGVTQRTYNAFRKNSGLKTRAVRSIMPAEVHAIMTQGYLEPVRFDELPAGLDYAVADFAVNSGPAKAARVLQRLVGVRQDGVIGLRTLEAVGQRDAGELIEAYCGARMSFLRSLKTFATFGKGWTSRVVGRRDGVQVDDIGVIDRAMMLHRRRAAADIPVPTVAAPAKADPQDVSSDEIIREIVKQPAAWATALGAIASPFAESEPLQFALATCIVIAAATVAFRFATSGRGAA